MLGDIKIEKFVMISKKGYNKLSINIILREYETMKTKQKIIRKLTFPDDRVPTNKNNNKNNINEIELPITKSEVIHATRNQSNKISSYYADTKEIYKK